MSNNQKDSRDQQINPKDQKSGEKKKPVLDPNNPKANQHDEQSSNTLRSESDSNASNSKGPSSKLN